LTEALDDPFTKEVPHAGQGDTDSPF
jgi:hypothetical protein